jgi:hypothetical protein
MAGLVPAIHVLNIREAAKTWMPATSAGMTKLINLNDRKDVDGRVKPGNDDFIH